MIRIAICDDETSILNLIENMIRTTCPNEFDYSIERYNKGQNLRNDYSQYGKYNIIFMDIEIGDCNGVEIIDAIRKIDLDVIVIFITSYADYVSKAFRVGAFQYLQKPIKIEDFKKDFSRALRTYRLLHTIYGFKNNGKQIALKFNEIYYFEVFNKKITIHLQNGSVLEDCRSSIKEKELQFMSYNFVRCHKSYLVNLQKISLIDKNNIVLKNGSNVPVSRNYRLEVLSQFNKYLARHKI